SSERSDLSGRTALVTGAARGLGRAIALAFAEAGADVALGLRDVSRDDGLADEIRSLGGRALPLQMDVRQLDQVEAAVAATVEELGALDLLVNNAGGGDEQVDRKSTRLNSSHQIISYAVFCLKKKSTK